MKINLLTIKSIWLMFKYNENSFATFVFVLLFRWNLQSFGFLLFSAVFSWKEIYVTWFKIRTKLQLDSTSDFNFKLTPLFSAAIGKKLPPAPGCVDQQLTALSTELIHNELDIPQAPSNTPYGLQILLDMFRVQYMNMINQMKSPSYKINVENCIKHEKVSI